jgi:hypothetical protein
MKSFNPFKAVLSIRIIGSSIVRSSLTAFVTASPKIIFPL